MQARGVFPPSLILLSATVAAAILIAFVSIQRKNKHSIFPGISKTTFNQDSGLYEFQGASLELPPRGSYQGTPIEVDPTTNVLLFRAQSFFSQPPNSLEENVFQFPDYNRLPTGTTASQAYNALINVSEVSPKINLVQNLGGQGSDGGLYSGESAKRYNFPWPPEAGVQLLQYVPFPDKPVTDSTGNNPISPSKSKPIVQYPTNSDPFVQVVSNVSTFYQTDPEKSSSLIQQIQLLFMDSGLVYVEAAGGPGGDFRTGTSPSLTYAGGSPGIVWGYVPVKKGDSWTVNLSRSGGVKPQTAIEVNSNIVSRDSFASGGGTGSFLSGSEGGGSVVVSTKPWSIGTTDITGPLPGKSNESVFLVAGGGGGASRNACGGPAGSYYTENITEAFGKSHPNPEFYGFAGGPTNVFEYTEPLRTLKVNQLSGGAGTPHQGGLSYTKETLNQVGSYSAADKLAVTEETSGSPLQGGTGSNNPPGGGGGGSGYFGGGAGLWNGRRAPNNEHGAGGGGSSFIGAPAVFTSLAGYPCGNPWYGSPGLAAFTSNLNAPQNNIVPINYFMLAIPQRG